MYPAQLLYRSKLQSLCSAMHVVGEFEVLHTRMVAMTTKTTQCCCSAHTINAGMCGSPNLSIRLIKSRNQGTSSCSIAVSSVWPVGPARAARHDTSRNPEVSTGQCTSQFIHWRWARESMLCISTDDRWGRSKSRRSGQRMNK